MGLYKNTNGVLTPIAGRGKAEYGASTVRKGTYSFVNASGAGWRYATVTFDTPMVDTDYEIILTPSVGTTSAQSMSTAYTIDNKTINGFRISYYDTAATSNVSGNYTAFKLYTDNEYNGLLQLSRPDLWPVNTEIDFGNGLYGQRFTGTITAAANAGISTNLYATHVKIYQFGGWVQYANNGETMQLAYNQNSGYAFAYYSTPSGGLKFYTLSASARTNAPYDIWCTYHKV